MIVAAFDGLAAAAGTWDPYEGSKSKTGLLWTSLLPLRLSRKRHGLFSGNGNELAAKYRLQHSLRDMGRTHVLGYVYVLSRAQRPVDLRGQSISGHKSHTVGSK